MLIQGHRVLLDSKHLKNSHAQKYLIKKVPLYESQHLPVAVPLGSKTYILEGSNISKIC